MKEWADHFLNEVTWPELITIAGLAVFLAISFLVWGFEDLFEVIEIRRALIK